MPSLPAPLSLLNSQCEEEKQRIRREFEAGAAAPDTLHALSSLADRTIAELVGQVSQNHHRRPNLLCVLALGGYGRGQLFPYSDLDIFFLFENKKSEFDSLPMVAEITRSLWDLGFRVGSACRSLEECSRIEADNAEFHLALLDRRFIAGDAERFNQLDKDVLPEAELRMRRFLREELVKLTRERLARYGNTIFHLEPNIKDSPGGLRDYQAAAWLRQIAGGKQEPKGAFALEAQMAAHAANFLSAVRCFLHYKNGRNDNTLTYELQAAAAARSLGVEDGVERAAADWMRLYFREARTLNRQLLRKLERKLDAPQTLRERILSAARRAKPQPATDRPFIVKDGLLEVLDPAALADRSVAISFFAESARTGTPPSREAERTITHALSHSRVPPRNAEVNWRALRQILAADFPGTALRSMYRVGLLAEVLPEFNVIDSLVVRDFYHRYTVDEHSLRTIENLQGLAVSPNESAKYFADLWVSLEKRDLLILALLLHDVGKGMPDPNHVSGSLQALDRAAQRLQLEPQEKDEVYFLIQHHLDMSNTMLRRDIFDHESIAAFSNAVATVERLTRLCLLTYADFSAVNPEALTPWRTEMLWQLFAASSNYLNRSVDTDRFHSSPENAALDEVIRQAPGATRPELEIFLEGFPRRYLATHSPAEIAAHLTLYKYLADEPVQIQLKAERHAYSLTLLTRDRPALFATICGVLAGWDMSIMKAGAFANSAGIVLDTFHFVDLHNALELNPEDVARFRRCLTDVVSGRAPLKPLLQSRGHSGKKRPPKIEVATKIHFDDVSSAHSTLLEILAQDRNGLLYEISSVLSGMGCNIEVALVDTEGQKAIDVFYLTKDGRKLPQTLQDRVASDLSSRI